MHLIQILGGTLLLQAVTSAPVAHAQRRSPLLNRIVRSVERQEPGWRFIPGVCTCPALVPGQKSYIAGGWHLGELAGASRHVGIYVSYVPSAQAAEKWMDDMSRWPMAEGWHNERYPLGDEAYLSRDEDGANSIVHFRKGEIVVQLTGELHDVMRFAGYVERAVPAAI